MITKGNQDNLSIILSNLSYKDFLKANPIKKRKINKNGRYKNKPYSSSDETLEVLDLYKLSLKQEADREVEESIKAYLLNVILIRPELLYDLAKYIKYLQIN